MPTDAMTQNAKSLAPAVQHGLMTQEQFDRLLFLLDNDQEAYIKSVTKMAYKSVPIWNHIFLGFDIAEFAIDVWNRVPRYRNNIVMLPRSHGKSYSFTFGLITHHVCYSTLDFEGNRFKDPRIMLIRESADAVTKDIVAIQNIIESGGPRGMIKAAFGNLREEAIKWNETTIHFGGGISRDFTLVGAGVGGSITGSHPKTIVIDDPVSKKNANTEHLRKEMWSWWTKTLVGMIDPLTRVFLLGTPYFYGDLYDKLLATKKYNVIRIPALNRMPRKGLDFEELFDEESGVRTGVRILADGQDLKALWPCPLGTGNCHPPEDHPDPAMWWEKHIDEYGEHRSVEYLIHEKFLEDPFDFSSQFMLNIVGAGETLFKPSMMRFYADSGDPRIGKLAEEYNDTEIIQEPDWPVEANMIVHAWDHAIGKRSVNDNTAFARLIRTRDNRVFVPPVIAERWDFPTAVDNMESFFTTEPYGRPAAIATEAIGFQEAYNQQLMRQSSKLLSGVVRPIKKSTDKATFYNEVGLPTAMLNHQVYFHIDDKDTIQEFLAFTPDDSSGFPDDRVDAVAIGWSIISQMVRKPARSWKIDVGAKDAFGEGRGGRHRYRRRKPERQ